VQRLLSEYHKAQEVAKELREKQGSFRREIEGLRLEGRRLLQEAEQLEKLSLDNALSAPERAERKKAFEEKIGDWRTFEVRYDNVRAQREAELQAFASQANKRVIEDIVTATRAVGEKEGVNLILNVNKAAPLASDVLFSKGVADVTEKVLVSLNGKK
jgi:Skp family chaperone for outer membrane proteins